MKCKNCGGEWTPPAGAAPLKYCPFCGTEIKFVPASLREALCAVAAERGRALLRNEEATAAAVLALSPALSDAVARLRLVYAVDGAALFDALALPEQERQAALAGLEKRLEEEYWISGQGAGQLSGDYGAALSQPDLPEGDLRRPTLASLPVGRAVACGETSYNRRDVSDWGDLIAISAGRYHTVGVRPDGTAVACGLYYNPGDGYNNVISGWRDLVAVSAGHECTIGLRADGTAVACGFKDGKNEIIAGWRDLITVSAKYVDAVGLRRDGTVVATYGYDPLDIRYCEGLVDVDINFGLVAGVRRDGSAVLCGSRAGKPDGGEYDGKYTYPLDSLRHIRGLTSVRCGDFHVVGLRRDGTAVAVGGNRYEQCEVGTWRDLVAVDANAQYSLGLRGDGTVVGCGRYPSGVGAWRGVFAISAGREHAVGLVRPEEAEK